MRFLANRAMPCAMPGLSDGRFPSTFPFACHVGGAVPVVVEPYGPRGAFLEPEGPFKSGSHLERPVTVEDKRLVTFEVGGELHLAIGGGARYRSGEGVFAIRVLQQSGDLLV